MLGDCLNTFDAVSMDRHYLSMLSGFYPVKRNAFDVLRNRCQARRLRLVESAIDPLLIADMDGNIVNRENEIRVMTNFAYRAEQEKNEPIQNIRRLTWNVEYLRESDHNVEYLRERDQRRVG